MDRMAAKEEARCIQSPLAAAASLNVLYARLDGDAAGC